MVRADNKVSASSNTVKGFSARFKTFLDWAHFPTENRITLAAERFGTAYNTVKAWYSSDKSPSSYSALVAVVEEILKDGPALHNPHSIAAWLLAGDAVAHPFAEESDPLALVDLHFQISDVAKKQGIQFSKLSRSMQNLILNEVRGLQSHEATGSAKTARSLDRQTVSALKVMLESIRPKSKRE